MEKDVLKYVKEKRNGYCGKLLREREQHKQ
jgi:hypothetical protein